MAVSSRLFLSSDDINRSKQVVFFRDQSFKQLGSLTFTRRCLNKNKWCLNGQNQTFGAPISIQTCDVVNEALSENVCFTDSFSIILDRNGANGHKGVSCRITDNYCGSDSFSFNGLFW